MNDYDGIMFFISLCVLVPVIIVAIKQTIEEKDYDKNGIGIKQGEIVKKSGGGQIHFNAMTGKPVGGSNYNPDDWMEHPEWVGKSNAELAEIVNRDKIQKAEQKDKEQKEKQRKTDEKYKMIEDNLEEIVQNLSIENINHETIMDLKNFFNAMLCKTIDTRWSASDGTLINIGKISREIVYIFMRPNWKTNHMSEMYSKITELKLLFCEFEQHHCEKIKEKVEYWEKISENLEDELMSLDLDNIDLELVKGIWEAFWLRWSLPSYNNAKKDVCFDGSDIFMEIEQAIEDGTWKDCKEEFRIKLDELKMQLASYDLSVPPDEHKEAFQNRLRELTR